MTPRRPGSSSQDRRQEILDVALAVFAEKGYLAATNREIARRAGVTAAALYWYFPSKEALFHACLAQRYQPVLPIVEKLAEWEEQPPEEVLPRVARAFRGIMQEPQTQALLRIVLAESVRAPELIQTIQGGLAGSILPHVLGYLRRQMERGRLRTMDPRVVQLMLAGPLLGAFLFGTVMQLPAFHDLDDEELVTGVVETLLRGLAPENGG